jgi:hypothetical protein
MRMLASTLYVVIVLAFSGPAFGEDGAGPDVSNPVDVNAVFGRYGFSITPHATGSSCSVTMTLAEKTFVDSIPELKQIGLLNNELTQTAINSKPNMISMAFVIEMLPVATREVYDSNKNVDICEFSQSLLAVDDYGNDKKIPMLTYEFSRSLYKKVNWDKFQAQNLMKIAPKFHSAPEFAQVLLKEAEGN